MTEPQPDAQAREYLLFIAKMIDDGGILPVGFLDKLHAFLVDSEPTRTRGDVALVHCAFCGGCPNDVMMSDIDRVFCRDPECPIYLVPIRFEAWQNQRVEQV